MIKAVIFDVDDTLYDFTKAHKAAFEELAAYAGRSLGLSREAFEKLHRETFEELKVRMGNVAAVHNRCIRCQVMLEKTGAPLYPHALKMNDLYWDTLLEAAVPFGGVPETLKQLKGLGMRIGIGTDMTARMQFKKLEALGLLPDIGFAVSSEEAGAEKPELPLFARCVEKAGCRAQECLFVGDSLEKDVRGALSAGLQALWYCPGGHEDREKTLQITNMLQLLERISAL